MSDKKVRINNNIRLQQANDFLAISSQFQLGNLSTEQLHPKTIQLSDLAQNDLPMGISLLKEVDLDALKVVYANLEQIKPLMKSIKSTLEESKSIFLCGCGATGRLSLVLETLWREKYETEISQNDNQLRNKVVSFMAGGDVALIQSIEHFEDYPEYGARHLEELGFVDGDLLICCTEGGETPYVIGACERATQLGRRPPFFLYCNPDKLLVSIERSKRVLDNSSIEKINLDVGPMALAGSTRMQASTVLMLAVGLGLWYFDRSIEQVTRDLELFIEQIEKSDFSFLEEFIIKEADCYSAGEYILYEADSDFGISILTDTTERSPTFSLHPFENQQDKMISPSLSYLFFPGAKSSLRAWQMLLRRNPRTFLWKGVTDSTSKERLFGFDFSKNLIELRQEYLKDPYHKFKIYRDEKAFIVFDFFGSSKGIPNPFVSNLFEHVFLKMLLNILSTLVMGRLGRYERNIMTWVRPSNYKLIDRTIRYSEFLLKEKGIITSYANIAYVCFDLMDQVSKDQSLVLEIVKRISSEVKIRED